MRLFIPGIFVLIMCASTSELAGQTDSLTTWLKTNQKPDTSRVRALGRLAYLKLYEHPDSAVSYIREGQSISEKKRYHRGIIYSNRLWSIYHYLKRDYDSSFYYAHRSLNLLNSLSPSYHTMESNIYSDMATMYKALDRYDSALEYYYRSLFTLEGSDTSIYRPITVWTNIGSIYRQVELYDKALEYYKLALGNKKSIHNELTLAQIYANMAQVYNEKQNYDTALSYSKASLLVIADDRLSCFKGAIYSNSASAYLGLDQLDSADHYTSMQLEIARSCSLASMEVEGLMNRARIEARKGQNQQSLNSLLAARTMAKDNAMAEKTLQTARSLYKYYRESGKTEESLHYLDEYLQLRDSIISNKIIVKLSVLETEYKMYKYRKDAELDQVQLEMSLMKQAYLKYIFLIALLLSLAMVYYLYRNTVKGKRYNKELLKLNREVLDQKEELANQSEQLAELNQKLEEKVKERTQEVEARNRKIFNYAYMNAHELRAPVASMLGLINLFKSKQVSSEERKKIADMISQASNKLDVVVQRIQRTLEREDKKFNS